MSNIEKYKNYGLNRIKAKKSSIGVGVFPAAISGVLVVNKVQKVAQNGSTYEQAVIQIDTQYIDNGILKPYSRSMDVSFHPSAKYPLLRGACGLGINAEWYDLGGKFLTLSCTQAYMAGGVPYTKVDFAPISPEGQAALQDMLGDFKPTLYHYEADELKLPVEETELLYDPLQAHKEALKGNVYTPLKNNKKTPAESQPTHVENHKKYQQQKPIQPTVQQQPNQAVPLNRPAPAPLDKFDPANMPF